ncbi:MAG: hypothetical protein L7U83_13775 [Akkermansiaceae bacterium]|nr:hypothetical protein [Akkermansiaceae bacterium]
MTDTDTEPEEAPTTLNGEQVGEHPLVRLEIDMIETRQVTKEIEVSKATADRLVGKLWGYENKKGWSEHECCSLIMRKEGKVTRERVYFECDTIDFIETNQSDSGA